MSKKQTDNKTDESIDLMDAATALKVVKDAIERERKRFEKIIDGGEQHPVMIEGETSEGYYCQLMVDPREVASIMLKYDYPVWNILMEDAPDAMWHDLAKKFGIMTVSSVDL